MYTNKDLIAPVFYDRHSCSQFNFQSVFVFVLCWFWILSYNWNMYSFITDPLHTLSKQAAFDYLRVIG